MGLFKTPDHLKFKGFFLKIFFICIFPTRKEYVHMFNIKEGKEKETKNQESHQRLFLRILRGNISDITLGNKPDQKQTNL